MEIYSTVQCPLREIPLRKINPDGRDDEGERERESTRPCHALLFLTHPSPPLVFPLHAHTKISSYRPPPCEYDVPWSDAPQNRPPPPDTGPRTTDHDWYVQYKYGNKYVVCTYVCTVLQYSCGCPAFSQQLFSAAGPPLDDSRSSNRADFLVHA